MKVIEITEIEVKAALDVAKSEEVKNVLVALFCKGEKKPTPTLDDYTTIRSYEDACAALKCSPIDEKALRSAGVRKGIIALIKLETISRALWGKNYQPKPDASGNSRFYFPWFALWTEREIKETEGLVYIPIRLCVCVWRPLGFGCECRLSALARIKRESKVFRAAIH